ALWLLLSSCRFLAWEQGDTKPPELEQFRTEAQTWSRSFRLTENGPGAVPTGTSASPQEALRKHSDWNCARLTCALIRLKMGRLCALSAAILQSYPYKTLTRSLTKPLTNP